MRDLIFFSLSLLRFYVIVALALKMTSVYRFIHKMKMRTKMKSRL